MRETCRRRPRRRYIHVRPKARNARDRETAPGGFDVIRKSFWLNSAYVEEHHPRADRTASVTGRVRSRRSHSQASITSPARTPPGSTRFRASRSRLSSNLRAQNWGLDFGKVRIAPRAVVPVAAVDEDRHATARVGDVGPARAPSSSSVDSRQGPLRAGPFGVEARAPCRAPGSRA